jgi:putative oxidoreductase
MQRLFSTFANGLPGKGLLIQRVLLTAILTYCLVSTVEKKLHFSAALPQLIGAGAGLFLLVGLWTPIAGAVVAIVELWALFSRPGGPSMMSGVLAILGATLAMIGPGAWSLDARLFGRKHIEISHR